MTAGVDTMMRWLPEVLAPLAIAGPIAAGASPRVTGGARRCLFTSDDDAHNTLATGFRSIAAISHEDAAHVVVGNLSRHAAEYFGMRYRTPLRCHR